MTTKLRLGESVSDKVRSSVWFSLYSPADGSVRSSIWESVSSSVDISVRSSMRDSINDVMIWEIEL